MTQFTGAYLRYKVTMLWNIVSSMLESEYRVAGETNDIH